MRRPTAYVSGNVQEVGYRGRIVGIARELGLTSIIENLLDGRVKIIAEGDDEKLKLFESAIDIKNALDLCLLHRQGILSRDGRVQQFRQSSGQRRDRHQVGHGSMLTERASLCSQ
jgi:acylphosphatase